MEEEYYRARTVLIGQSVVPKTNEDKDQSKKLILSFKKLQITLSKWLTLSWDPQAQEFQDRRGEIFLNR